MYICIYMYYIWPNMINTNNNIIVIYHRGPHCHTGHPHPPLRSHQSLSTFNMRLFIMMCSNDAHFIIKCLKVGVEAFHVVPSYVA